MPTGYTADVVDGKMTEFNDFAWRCARAFGALMHIRDEPLGAPIPDTLAADDYYVTGLHEAEAELETWDKLSAADKLTWAVASREESIASALRYDDRNRTENERIDVMVSKVRMWSPPTPDHKELKAFMLEQLNISRHDMTYSADRIHEERAKTAATIMQRERDNRVKHVAQRREALAAEMARVANRGAWIKSLRDSLNHA